MLITHYFFAVIRQKLLSLVRLRRSMMLRPFVCLIVFTFPVVESAANASIAIRGTNDACMDSRGVLFSDETVETLAQKHTNWTELSQLVKTAWDELIELDKLGKGCFINSVDIRGKIDRNTEKFFISTADAISAMQEDLKFTRIFVTIKSPGGLIYSAMNMGKRVSQFDQSWVVAGQCDSACVLFTAAFRGRIFSTDPGIHRPFSNNIETDEIDYTDILEKYEKTFEHINHYFSIFGVSKNIVEIMRSTRSTDMYYLSKEERERYGLGGRNVADGEFYRSRIVELCGKERADAYFSSKSVYADCLKLQPEIDGEAFLHCKGHLGKMIEESRLQQAEKCKNILQDRYFAE